MGTNNDDAQRDFEQKALRNVRGLVDKIESEDSKGRQKQIVGVFIIVVVVAMLAGAFLIGRSKEADPKTVIEIVPPTKPVAK
jgi:hypothetical protein